MDISIRLFQVIDALKKEGKIIDYKSLADSLGIHKTALSDIKHGRKKVSVDLLCGMKKAYNEVDLDFIVLGIGTPLKSYQILDEVAEKPSQITARTDDQILKDLVDRLDKKAEEIGRLKAKIDYQAEEIERLKSTEVRVVKDKGGSFAPTANNDLPASVERW